MRSIFKLSLIYFFVAICTVSAQFGFFGAPSIKITGILKMVDDKTQLVVAVHTDDKQIYRLDRVNPETISQFANQRVEVEGTEVKAGLIHCMHAKKIRSLDDPPKSLLDSITQFYLSSLSNPPKIDIDVSKVMGLADSCDIIIENNRAFPQWYVMIAGIVPTTRYVHGGIVVKGFDLIQLRNFFDDLTKGKNSIPVYRRGLVNEHVKGKVVPVWEWLPSNDIDPNRPYVITPDVVVKTKMSCIVALDMEHYLCDPKYGFSTKHIKVIRLPLKSQSQKLLVEKYLGYNLAKKTEYDMGFSIMESDQGFSVDKDDEVKINFDLAPVPLYCTEMIYRAFNETLGIKLPTTQCNRLLLNIISRIPFLPKGLVGKVKEPFVTADCFIKTGEIVYQNQDSPSPEETIKELSNDMVKGFCKKLMLICTFHSQPINLE
ncbi:MAG: hypothetical protein HQM08_05945 [Candidatus Riflebacteria bacterium]|nr:hypothetical protein [Candidatus Riflebacteria bacterium]